VDAGWWAVDARLRVFVPGQTLITASTTPHVMFSGHSVSTATPHMHANNLVAAATPKYRYILSPITTAERVTNTVPKQVVVNLLYSSRCFLSALPLASVPLQGQAPPLQ
jgi:hypothetical protein